MTAAFVEVGDDIRFVFERELIIVRLIESDGFIAVETMPARFASRFNTENFAVDNLLAQQHDQPMYRAHEFGATRTPAHALGYREFLQRYFDDAWKKIDGEFVA